MQITDETRKLALGIGVAASVAFSSTALVLAATSGNDDSGAQLAAGSGRPAVAQQDGTGATPAMPQGGSTGVAPTAPQGGTTGVAPAAPSDGSGQSGPALQSGTS